MDLAFPSAYNNNFNKDNYLDDSGASTHIGNIDEGLFDVTEINESVMLTSGKSLKINQTWQSSTTDTSNKW